MIAPVCLLLPDCAKAEAAKDLAVFEAEVLVSVVAA